MTLLEECGVEDKGKREQFYYDTLKPLYNIYRPGQTHTEYNRAYRQSERGKEYERLYNRSERKKEYSRLYQKQQRAAKKSTQPTV